MIPIFILDCKATIRINLALILVFIAGHVIVLHLIDMDTLPKKVNIPKMDDAFWIMIELN